MLDMPFSFSYGSMLLTTKAKEQTVQFKSVIYAARHSFGVVYTVAVVLQFGVLAGSSQTGDYLYGGTQNTITLNAGTYDIIAYGAQGGGGGGLGAEMEGEFLFTGKTTLQLLVGGGGGGSSIISSGGGGGSFVVEISISQSTPLVIAGGGGGSDIASGGGFGLIGTSGGSGGSGANGGGGGGGTSGGGGGGGSSNGDGSSGGGSGGGSGGVYGGAGGGIYGGAGGGGYLGNGGANDNDGGYSWGSGGRGGSNGGGNGGGGGGGDWCGGGGGGYSGGGGGGAGNDTGGGGYPGGGGGGGGGSYIDSSATAVLAEVSGVASPHDPPNGEIIITLYRPVLHVHFNRPNVYGIIQWFDEGTNNYMVEECQDISQDNWVTNTLPVTFNNGTNEVTVPLTNNAMFFRLRSQ